MEELRALVRKWKLHHQRHFWRENATKDDVVAALNRHIKRVKHMHDDLEHKRAEKEAGRKRQTQTTAGESGFRSRILSCPKYRLPSDGALGTRYQALALPHLTRSFEANPTVDSIETGLVYMSRWGQEKSRIQEQICNNFDEPVETETAKSEDATPRRLGSDKGDEDDCEDLKDRVDRTHAQQRCSMALLNMSMRDQVHGYAQKP